VTDCRSTFHVKRFQVRTSLSSQRPFAAGAVPVARFQHSHHIAVGTFANVGIKGPLEGIDSSGALDSTFSRERAAGRLANVKSASLRSIIGPLILQAAVIPILGSYDLPLSPSSSHPSGARHEQV
jgi:hypothetical protein